MHRPTTASITSHPSRTKIWFKLLSNVAIPLIIGAFTVIIAVYQQNIAQSNRDKDAAQAADLRRKDLENALAQRIENNKTAQAQRADDEEIARLQRELDRNMTREKLMQENDLAEKQRQLFASQREHELQIAYQTHLNEVLLEEERQKENVLVNFQQQLASLLLDYDLKFQQTHDRFRFVIQMKTRAALRLLNPARRTILIRSLYLANLLIENWKGEKSLLFRANVSGTHFGHSTEEYEYDSETLYEHLGINEADARYASFRQVSFLSAATFDYSNLDHTDWSYALLNHITFENQVSMNAAIFYQSTLENVEFLDVDLNRISFESNLKCDECTFSRGSMIGARLDHSYFSDALFEFLSMIDSSMHNASFIRTIFSNVTLDRVNLSDANFARCEFKHVSMRDCVASKTTVVYQSNFYHVDLTGCKGFTETQIWFFSEMTDVVLP